MYHSIERQRNAMHDAYMHLQQRVATQDALHNKRMDMASEHSLHLPSSISSLLSQIQEDSHPATPDVTPATIATPATPATAANSNANGSAADVAFLQLFAGAPPVNATSGASMELEAQLAAWGAESSGGQECWFTALLMMPAM